LIKKDTKGLKSHKLNLLFGNSEIIHNFIAYFWFIQQLIQGWFL